MVTTIEKQDVIAQVEQSFSALRMNKDATVQEDLQAAVVTASHAMLLANVEAFQALTELGEVLGNDYVMPDLQFAPGTGIINWRKYLLTLFAEATFCRVVFEPKGFMCTTFGSVENLRAMQMMYELTIDMLTQYWLKTRDSYPKKNMSVFNSVMIDAGTLLEEAVKEMRKIFFDDHTGADALVKALDKAVDAAFVRYDPSKAARASRSVIIRSAMDSRKTVAYQTMVDLPPATRAKRASKKTDQPAAQTDAPLDGEQLSAEDQIRNKPAWEREALGLLDNIPADLKVGGDDLEDAPVEDDPVEDAASEELEDAEPTEEELEDIESEEDAQ